MHFFSYFMNGNTCNFMCQWNLDGDWKTEAAHKMSEISF